MPVEQLRVGVARSSQHQRVSGETDRRLDESGCHDDGRQLDLKLDWLMMLSHVSPSSMKEVWISDAPEERQMMLLRRAKSNRHRGSLGVHTVNVDFRHRPFGQVAPGSALRAARLLH
jgi:hypothetical protein